MKVHHLLEGDLSELQEVLLLMKHGKMSREDATILAKQLKDFTFYVGGKHVPAKLRWVEDRKTATLKFISADMPGSWRSGTAAIGRGKVLDLLQKQGFKVARFASDAIKRQHNTFNGPHIFFWGLGSPEPKKENFAKVWGTEESRKALEDRVKNRQK